MGAERQADSKMVVKSGGNWKRPVNRMYTYNFQIGENYYLPMTSYLETKTGASSDVPGPLCFSERISLHPLSGTSPWRPSRRRDKSSPTCKTRHRNILLRFSIFTTPGTSRWTAEKTMSRLMRLRTTTSEQWEMSRLDSRL